MLSVELLAGGLGLIVGGLASGLWSWLSKRLGDDGFWPRLNQVMQLLLSSEPDNQFFREYLKLLPFFVKHVAKKLAVALVALSPVVLAWLMLSPLANSVWYRHPIDVEIYPAQALSIRTADSTLELHETDGKIPYSDELARAVSLITAAGEFQCPTLLRKQAYSSTLVQRWLLPLIGFQLLAASESVEPLGGAAFLIQPTSGDNNCLWPYLNDWEFDFFACLSLASVAGMAFSKVRKN